MTAPHRVDAQMAPPPVTLPPPPVTLPPPPRQYIIGLAGKKGVGKDTVASLITRRVLIGGETCTRLDLADPLKEACRLLFGFDDDHLYGDQKESLDPFWNATPREILQWVGTECLRERLGGIMVEKGRWATHQRRDFWLRLAGRQVEAMMPHHVVITDVRFDNEARWILAQPGGRVVNIRRDAAPRGDGHASEVGLDIPCLSWEYPGAVATLTNNSCRGTLFRALFRALECRLAIPVEVRS